MQAKMRSLLRLLVKSIIGDRERQADATVAREAHHSASPRCGPLCTQHTGHWDCGSRDTCSHTQTWSYNFTPRNRIQHFFFFYCHRGTHLHFFRQLETRGKSMVESLTNVMAVKHERYLLSPEMFYIRLSMMVLIALSLKTLRLALFIPQLQEPYAAEPH